jgi:hypothetical protein
MMQKFTDRRKWPTTHLAPALSATFGQCQHAFDFRCVASPLPCIEIDLTIKTQ